MGDKLPTIITNDLHTEQGDTAYEEFRALSKEPPAWMNDSVRPPPPDLSHATGTAHQRSRAT